MPELLDWLKGKRLAAWLKDQNPTEDDLRRIREFQNKKRVSYYSVDGVLTRMGLHEQDIPRHLWWPK